MSKTILLAVDSAHPVRAAAEVTGNLSKDSGDRVVVMHAHEIAVGRFGRIQVCCPEGEGERLVADMVDRFKQAGITADSDIREARFGHAARMILTAAEDHDARMIVLGSSNRTDLPHIPFGSVSNRLLHLAERPVLIVPRQTAVPPSAQPVTGSEG
jgi:nucleotide-binding universal stress UspA family protein